jgi:hypothetical protein
VPLLFLVFVCSAILDAEHRWPAAAAALGDYPSERATLSQSTSQNVFLQSCHSCTIDWRLNVEVECGRVIRRQRSKDRRSNQ